MARNNANFSLSIAVKNADGSARDLTGQTFEMQWKNQRGTNALATFTTGDGTLTTEVPATAGLMTLVVPFATMQAIPPGRIYFDILQLVDSLNRIAFGGGYIEVTGGITENDTTALPKEPPLDGEDESDVVLTEQADSVTLTLAPGGAAVAVIVASAGPPAPPAAGFILYYDTSLGDGWLKAISAAGKITDLAPPS